ncbi:MAG: hypothetical protein COX62_01635 [Deltaproteobacteria bacterium CG_4_10_14_0_2_um_filter_43_8]|nr:MAG: hypothetical protein COV43_00860 [Deltaproteobacteria bacterium CG11_big_fil_rev_8_21_14_0_20_42_23]PJA21727.1 MAG: hypothetical protein COX62_01635 [Deltaproteobacteria bacterium CG_4_10_14_0_2_um_filter_43_8]PJC64566.1 MAG: hypothetical protein CO021_03845 [Deltaproteobacteria bacterium CG_4_9_14_0_2_um_filter_42_21]
MTNKIIVVGKNSYIGSYLTESLRTRDCEVVLLSSKDCDFRNLKEVNAFFSTLSGHSVTIVFLAVIKKDDSNNYQSYLNNISLVNNLIQAGVSKNIRSIVYLSSVDVYGNKPILPISEQTKIEPDTWYGLAKYTCEWILTSTELLNCPIAILRIPGIFGNACNDKSVIGKMISNSITDARIEITGNEKNLRDYVCVDDVCALIWLCICKQYHGLVNVASGKSRSILDIAKCIKLVLNLDAEIVVKSSNNNRTFDLVFDNSKLISSFPEFRFTELETAIKSYR